MCQLGLTRQRLARRLLRRGPQRELDSSGERGDAPRAGVLGGELLIRGDRRVVAPCLLLARPHHERPAHVVGIEALGGACYHDRGVAAPGGRERRREPELECGVARLPLGLGNERGDLRRRDDGRFRGGRAGPGKGNEKEGGALHG